MGQHTRRGNNIDYGFGQFGSIHCNGTEAVTCAVPDKVFVAITFLEDSKFAASGGLVPEVSQLYPASGYNSTLIDADAGDVTASLEFPKGLTIYGRWTEFKLQSGDSRVIAYIG